MRAPHHPTLPGSPKEPKIISQYPKIERIGSIGSIILAICFSVLFWAILELQVPPILFHIVGSEDPKLQGCHGDPDPEPAAAASDRLEEASLLREYRRLQEVGICLDLPTTLNWNLIVLIWWYLESNRG